MQSSIGLFWSSTDDDWTSAPCVDTLLETRMIRNLISAANMSQTTWFDHRGKVFFPVDQALWTGLPSILDLWLSPIPVFVFKIQAFAGCYPLTTSCLNGELAFDFPELLQGCTLFSEAEQRAPVPGLPASQTALQGVVVVVVVVVGTCGFLRPC